ncbi:unnamed protein product [Ilex paraguariensis]|uniref:Uncharacterized protein n=1 Tax=Ilex paraguariensis TaxID=185542 RepID=A0ABC8TTW1_9AQUA
MQEIVGDRLPKFTKEEVKMVKHSIHYVGINQYTAYYLYDQAIVSHQQDWNCGFAYDRKGVPTGPKVISVKSASISTC